MRDGYVSPYRRLIRPGDGFRPVGYPGSYLLRGGGSRSLAPECRSGTRSNREIDFLGSDQGLRSARPVDD